MAKPTYDVAIALLNRADRWLVARRPDHAHLGGYWEFPGGKLHPGESPAQAAVRELHEECAIRARARRTLPMLTCDYSDRIVRITPVVCTWEAGDARAIASEECRWVDLSELRALRMPEINADILCALGES